MTHDRASDSQLNQVVREQLRALQIDPDTIFARSSRSPRQWFTWRPSGWDLMAVCGICGILVFALIVASIVAVSSSPQFASAHGLTSGPTVVTFGDTTVNLPTSAIRLLSKGNAALDLQLNVSNPGAGRAVLLAGDVALVDARGAMVAPSWQAADGTWHEGLSEPTHALIGLEPGSQSALGVTFVIVSPGPFSLRYSGSTALPVSISLQ